MSIPSRPVSGFVPLSDVAGAVELPGGRALTPAAPQARHHFTTLQQVNQLVEASEAEARSWVHGAAARAVQPAAYEPRRPPAIPSASTARTSLIMSAGGDGEVALRQYSTSAAGMGLHRSGADAAPRAGPRPGSLYEFMRKLGMEDRSGGAHGERTRLKNQMRRLFRCGISLVYTDGARDASVSSYVA